MKGASVGSEDCRFLVQEDGLFYELFTLKRVMKDGTAFVQVRPDDNFDGLSEKPLEPAKLGGVGKAAEFRFSLHPSIGNDGLTACYRNQKANPRLICAIKPRYVEKCRWHDG